MMTKKRNRKPKKGKHGNSKDNKEVKLTHHSFETLSSDELFFQCPFEDDYYTSVIPDEMFAHMCINHKPEKRGRPSIQNPAVGFLLKNLSQRVSKKCYVCKDNSFEYKDRQKLREHYQVVHATVREYEICTHCDRRMLKNSLKKHLNDLNSEKRSCEICGQMYSPHNLQKHKRVAHADKEAVQCPTCDKVFYWSKEKQKKGLMEHIQSVHVKYKPFVCEICGKKMTKYFNLDEHRQKVHGSKKLSIGTYREMIESGNYKFLLNVPTNLDYSGLIIKNMPTGSSNDLSGQEPNKDGHELDKDVQQLEKEIRELDKDMQELEKERQEPNKDDEESESDKEGQESEKAKQESEKVKQEPEKVKKEPDSVQRNCPLEN